MGKVLEACSSILRAWLSARTKDEAEKGRVQRGRLNTEPSTQHLGGVEKTCLASGKVGTTMGKDRVLPGDEGRGCQDAKSTMGFQKGTGGNVKWTREK